jgi:hypothetical protein
MQCYTLYVSTPATAVRLLMQAALGLGCLKAWRGKVWNCVTAEEKKEICVHRPK